MIEIIKYGIFYSKKVIEEYIENKLEKPDPIKSIKEDIEYLS